MTQYTDFTKEFLTYLLRVIRFCGPHVSFTPLRQVKPFYLPLFTKFASTQQFYVQIYSNEFNPNRKKCGKYGQKFIFAFEYNAALTQSIFMKNTIILYFYDIPCIEFYPNRTNSVESTNKILFTPLAKQIVTKFIIIERHRGFYIEFHAHRSINMESRDRTSFRP